MNYIQLRKLRDELRKKQRKNGDEEEMLKELETLNCLLDKQDFSLSAPDVVCHACGRKLI